MVGRCLSSSDILVGLALMVVDRALTATPNFVLQWEYSLSQCLLIESGILRVVIWTPRSMDRSCALRARPGITCLLTLMR